MNIRVTYFTRNISDGLDYNYFSNQYFNYNQEKDQGIEWENKIRFNKIFSLSANYTWLHAREQSQSRISYKDTVYGYALRRPASTINFTVGIQPTDQVSFNIGGHYESKRYDVGGYDASFNPLPDVELASFFILNAYAEYRPSSALKFFVDAKNITNKKFLTINGYNSIPAMFVAGLAVRL
ncbi:MAG TPA: TonB-dependent receptor, partial [Puia sp.]|nr:TonB-dependent receptor [Puia sp.]